MGPRSGMEHLVDEHRDAHCGAVRCLFKYRLAEAGFQGSNFSVTKYSSILFCLIGIEMELFKGGIRI